MSIAGSIDAAIDVFGGLVTDMSPADLPPGVSPDCADVGFTAGAVNTRPGLLSVFTALASNPTVNYLKTYATLNATLRLLLLDSNGVLYKETAPGTLAQIASGLTAGAYAKSATLFGREYIAISDGKAGSDLPRQFDDANFDRVSQVGPAGAPTAVDTTEGSFTIAAAPNGAIRASNVVTMVTAVVHNLLAGQTVIIAGVTDASFNGTFTIASVPGATTFTYAQAAADATSGGGTATLQGNISPGQRSVVVIFKTRQGYLTAPSPIATWAAAGNRRVTISNIPTGPSNVVARILAFTGAGGGSYFYLGAGAPPPSLSMVIQDNTTTTATFDFTDVALLAGTNVDYLFRLVELGECAGVIDYADRLFWWGERAKQNNWLNLTFDGGFSGGVPLGWSADTTFGAGGSKDTTNAIWGHAYRVTGNGATATRGLIAQTAVADANGVTRIAANTDYSLRARVLKGGGLAQGTLHVHLFSISLGINTAGLQLTAAQAPASGGFAEFTAQLSAPLGAVPGDLVLRVFTDGTPTNNGYFVVDNIEIYPTAQPVNASLVRASRTNDPETYDGIAGLLSLAPANGQAIRAAFKLRERLYFVKERSLYATEDDGVNEPALWTISEISRAVGTPSAHGVDVGEDWAVILDRSGLYLFGGGEPVKISQEIQPTWDSINWSAGHTSWVRVDTRNKRILCGVPIGAATAPNRILALDYRGLDSAGEIVARPPVHLSLAGKLVAVDRARKWAPWFITANAAALVERTDGTAQMFLGNGAGNGKVFQLSVAQLSDDGAAINGYYVTSFLPGADLELAGLGAHRKLFTYMTTYVEGAGLLALTAFPNSASQASALPPLALSNPAPKDLELPINVTGERVAFKFGTSAAGQWFRMQKFVPVLRTDPWAPVRGGN